MSAPKVHYSFYNVEPNESDSAGDEALACGSDFAHKTTTSEAGTTCKNCLRALARAPQTAPDQAKSAPATTEKEKS